MSIAIITGSSGWLDQISDFFHDRFDIIGIDNNLRKFFFGQKALRFQLK